MEVRPLGRTGVRVSSFCLGTMMFGTTGGTSVADCRAMVDRALDAGINFIDTADVYSRGQSEEIVGEVLGARRDDVVLATKFYNPMSRNPNHRGASRRWIIEACENSLRRLRTDYIDLYQVHRLDENTDLDETLSALSDLVRAGKVRTVGTSTWPAEWMVEAQWVAQTRGHVLPRCEQPPYSIFVRGPERDVFPTAQRHGMGVIVWSPLNGVGSPGNTAPPIRYRRDRVSTEGSPVLRDSGGSTLPEHRPSWLRCRPWRRSPPMPDSVCSNSRSPSLRRILRSPRPFSGRGRSSNWIRSCRPRISASMRPRWMPSMR